MLPGRYKCLDCEKEFESYTYRDVQECTDCESEDTELLYEFTNAEIEEEMYYRRGDMEYDRWRGT